MLTVTAAVVALAAAPIPVTPLSVAVASTCDYLIISVSNPSTESVTIRAKYGPATKARTTRQPSLVVRPGDTIPINLPAYDGLTAAVTINNGATLGPWLWKAPQVCPQMGGSVTDEPTAAATPNTFTFRTNDGGPEQSVYRYLFYAGLIAGALGLLAMVPWVWSRRLFRRLTGRRTPSGRHRRTRQPPRPAGVVTPPRRRGVKRLPASRR